VWYVNREINSSFLTKSEDYFSVEQSFKIDLRYPCGEILDHRSARGYHTFKDTQSTKKELPYL